MKLLHGDCLELMKDIPDKSVDMILTDPPYGTTACKWDSVIPFEPMWEQLNRIIKDNGAIVLFGSEPFSSKLRCSNLKMYRYDWIWTKTKYSNFLCLKKQPAKNYENGIVFYKHQPSYYPQMKEGKPYIDKRSKKNRKANQQKYGCGYNEITVNKGERYPDCVIHFPNGNNKNVHSTQKSTSLLEYLIKTYTLENETVLDFTMGSGSTGVACVNTNRNFIGIELDDKYFEIAKNRIEEAQNEKESMLFSEVV